MSRPGGVVPAGAGWLAVGLFVVGLIIIGLFSSWPVSLGVMLCTWGNNVALIVQRNRRGPG